ncbi:hypothetical protein BC943DRAFT_349628 [Umbelopsis sp. AD052]|nr:hypothetical protein BC943DRAFT_349628 [Umbelopsis sp. AD052]
MAGVHFHDAFWHPPTRLDDHSIIPNFQSGLNVLHERLTHSELENEDIIRYVRARIDAELLYAETLANLESVPCMSESQDTGLSQCFSMIRRESTELAATHNRLAHEISGMVLQPLLRLSSKYRRVTQNGRDAMDTQIRQFDLLTKPLYKLRQIRDKKCTDLEVALPKQAAPELVLNETSYSVEQIQDLVLKLKQFIASLSNDTTADAAMVPPSTLIEYFITRRLASTYDQAEHIINRLLDLKILTEQPLDHDVVMYSLAHIDPIEILPNSNTKVGGLFGMWQQQGPDEASLNKLRTMAEAADEAFRTAVEKADEMRLILEESMFAHLDEMENIEMERIRGLKQAFTTLAATMSNIIPNCKDTYDRLMLYQETLRPAADVQYIVEQYRTGRYCPRPILYVDYHNKPRQDLQFGIPLDAAVEASDHGLPMILSKGLGQLDTVCKRLFDEEISVIWVTDVPLDRVHEARAELNCSDIDNDTVKKFDPLLLAAVLRLYLQELPECLLTFDLYDPAKVLYANNNLDDVTRIQSISNLLSTLPAANYKASELLIRHLHELTSSCKAPLNETLPGKIAAVLGPILLRPRVDSTITVHDKCPHRLVKDLIEFCDAIFSASARESHLHNISRSALIAPTIPQQDPSAEIDTTTPVPNRRKTIFSYLRGPSKPNDETDLLPPASNNQPAIQKPSRRPIAPPRSSTLFEMDGRASPSKDLFRRSSDTSLFSKRPSTNPSILSKSSSSATSLDYDEKEISMSPINVDNIDAFFDD